MGLSLRPWAQNIAAENSITSPGRLTVSACWGVPLITRYGAALAPKWPIFQVVNTVHPPGGATWSPESSTFAIGDENGDLQLYDRDGHSLGSRQSSFDINTIAWSPDGSLLAAGRDVWKPDGTHLTGISGRVNSLAWSADGQVLAVAADELITLVRADGTHLAVLSDHSDMVNRVAWSPVQLILASASNDGTIRLWRLPPTP
jgi:WD40 repeat protein